VVTTAAVEKHVTSIIAEVLTNTVKHAQASSARITAVLDGGVLWLEVRDDGVGGAVTDGSSGLLGLGDRAAALNGRLRIESPPGEGTLVAAALPIPPLDRQPHPDGLPPYTRASLSRAATLEESAPARL